MDDTRKRAALREYFTRNRAGEAVVAIIFAAVGVGFIHASNLLPGLILTIIGAIGLIAVFANRLATDDQVDEWFTEDVKEITEKSINKLGLEGLSRLPPLPIRGPIWWTTVGVPREDLLKRPGKDGTVRFSINRITVIHLADHVLAAYSCDFNFLKNVALNERTDEYHYRDIVAVSTQEISTSYTLPTGKKLVNTQAFRLSVASGEQLIVAIGTEKLAEVAGGALPSTGAEKAIQVIRTRLREKKQ